MTSSSPRPAARQQNCHNVCHGTTATKKAAITTTLVVQKAKETAANAVDSYYKP
jgi:hypothetical protein